MPDVEMKPTDATKDKNSKPTSDKKAEEAKPAPLTPVQEIKNNISLIERAVATLEPRFTHRVLRTLASLRKKLDPTVLRTVVQDIYKKDTPEKQVLLSWIPESPPSDVSMEVEPKEQPAPSTAPSTAPTKSAQEFEQVPESEIYIRLLILHNLLTSQEHYERALALSQETVEKMQALNRRSMDPIAAKVWYAVDRAFELGSELNNLRPILLAAQRTAALRHDEETEATLLNRLLRNYIHYSHHSLADKLVSKTTFPSSAGNPQHARYHYYLGRIKAVQLNYSEAHTNLQQAIRRAPQPRTAPGFYQAVHKLFIVVELLMGEIPERSLFRHPVLEKALVAYFEIVKAVRTGSLSTFQTTLSTYASQFSADHTHTLIVRLRQNVIKTGIRRLSLSYSRISLRDICIKLHLDSEEDAEYIVGKAIRDGVIEGRIVHEKGWMECWTMKNSYGPEVSDVFGRRIAFCLELHNESVKAMRYPLNAHRKELRAAEDARERERELAKEIEDLDDIGDGF